MSVRVSTRGVRTSIGPRIARVNMGSGRTSVSSGLGPFFASTTLGGNRRRSTARSRPHTRSVGPTLAQLERARRAAERSRQDDERDARIRELEEMRRRSTSVHIQDFPAALPPQVPAPPSLGEAWARAEAEAFHLRGVGRLARSERAAARRRAADDAPRYLAAERARLDRVHRELVEQAAAWWRDVLANDELTVCEAVNAAFADNPAAGCAVGLRDGVLSVVMRQQDLDTLPTQTPGLTPTGRPTLKTLTKRDRTQWWLTIMGSNLVATVKEALAVAPAISAVDLAVLTRLPDSRRLDVVASGRWTRRAITTTPWREASDALKFLDIGENVRCAVTTTTSRIRPLDTAADPDLSRLVESAIDDGLDGGPDGTDEPAPGTDDPYAIVPFDRWATGGDEPPPPPPPTELERLVPGQALVLPDAALTDLTVDFTCAGAEADLTLMVLGADRRVRSDDDFVFYNQPVAVGGAARLVGRHRDHARTTERAELRLGALPDDVDRIAISVNLDVASGQTCAALHDAEVHLACPSTRWTIPAPADPQIRAVVLAEIYRHTVDGVPVWKLRAVGQGWADGLPALARAYGVDVT